MAGKRKKSHPTDGLKDLGLYFDGSFKNPLLSKMQPFIQVFGGKIYNRFDDRVQCVVQGENPSLTQQDLSKFPKIRIMSYKEFFDEFFSENRYY